MAIASITPPYPLLFDYLLASSWTWFAICLATIATSLRALRLFLLRHRLVSQPPSPILPFPSSSAPLSCTLPHTPSLPSLSSHTHFQRRTRSKSTSALENLHRNGEGFLRSGMEFLSSVLDADFSPSLKKITSASKLFHDRSSCEKHQSRGLCAFSAATDSRRSEVHNLTKPGPDSDDGLGLSSGLGSDSQTLVQENEAPCTNDKEQQLHIEEDPPSWLPSWAYSLSFPSASSLSEDRDDTVLSREMPCFEKQFGWDRLLESKLGSPWHPLSRCSRFAEESSNVVKMWAGQQKKLLKTLDAHALSLDMCPQTSSACTGNFAGEISLWELGRKAYSKASASFAQPVVALSMNSEQGATVVGSGKGMGLWDQRSSICMPLRLGNAMSSENITLSSLKSRGIGLCVANSDTTMSMYDLRKLHGEPLYSGRVPKRAPGSSDSDDEAYFNLLEMLTCDFEEDFWDEGCVTSTGNGLDLQKGGSSLLSHIVSFMRGLSTSAK